MSKLHNMITSSGTTDNGSALNLEISKYFNCTPPPPNPSMIQKNYTLQFKLLWLVIFLKVYYDFYKSIMLTKAALYDQNT